MPRFFTSEMEYKPALMRILIGSKTEDKKNPYKYIAGGFKSYSTQYSLKSTDKSDNGIYY